MNLKNITLNTAELGPVQWEDVVKLQPSENGFICFVSFDTKTRIDMDGEETEVLVGKYIQTPFNYAPSYKEVINYIVQQEYPNGKEAQILRMGIHNPNDEEYIAYYNKVEEIVSTIESLLK